MRLRTTHLDFWCYKKSVKPSWDERVATPRSTYTPNIDALVNAHAGQNTNSSEPGNTLAILKSARRRGVLMETLRSLTQSPSLRRRAYCKRWLKRIEELR